jgi:hypothetical protein
MGESMKVTQKPEYKMWSVIRPRQGRGGRRRTKKDEGGEKGGVNGKVDAKHCRQAKDEKNGCDTQTKMMEQKTKSRQDERKGRAEECG